MNRPSFYIVSRLSLSDELEPSQTPRVFGTFKQARAVAYKLSEESGETFVVFKSVFHTRAARVQGFYYEGCEE